MKNILLSIAGLAYFAAAVSAQGIGFLGSSGSPCASPSAPAICVDSGIAIGNQTFSSTTSFAIDVTGATEIKALAAFNCASPTISDNTSGALTWIPYSTNSTGSFGHSGGWYAFPSPTTFTNSSALTVTVSGTNCNTALDVLGIGGSLAVFDKQTPASSGSGGGGSNGGTSQQAFNSLTPAANNEIGVYWLGLQYNSNVTGPTMNQNFGTSCTTACTPLDFVSGSTGSATATGTSGQNTITVTGVTGNILVGQRVQGTNLHNPAFVTAYNSGTGVVTLNANNTGTVSTTVTFSSASNGLAIWTQTQTSGPTPRQPTATWTGAADANMNGAWSK